jgi:hypothetical protein
LLFTSDVRFEVFVGLFLGPFRGSVDPIVYPTSPSPKPTTFRQVNLFFFSFSFFFFLLLKSLRGLFFLLFFLLFIPQESLAFHHSYPQSSETLQLQSLDLSISFEEIPCSLSFHHLLLPLLLHLAASDPRSLQVTDHSQILPFQPTPCSCCQGNPIVDRVSSCPVQNHSQRCHGNSLVISLPFPSGDQYERSR